MAGKRQRRFAPGARIASLALVLSLTGGTLAAAVVFRQGNLRITALSQVMPFRLPRTGTAPVSVLIAGHLGTVDGSTPPQLQRMAVLINRHGLLQSEGLPVCQLRQVRAASSGQALANCSEALMGSGQFWASVVFPDQPPYRTQGRLLVFNGRQKGKPVFLVQISTSHPFPTGFVIPFAIHKVSKGRYGTELSASLPQALGSWGYVDRIKLTLKRQYTYRGRKLSYFNAGCPAPQGFKGTTYPLALATFYFAGEEQISAKVIKSCGVRR